MYFKRKKYLDKIYKYLETEKLILLFWSRQVWKTTLINMIIEDDFIKKEKIYINFEDIYDQSFKSKQDFIKYLEFNYKINFDKDWILFLDEIQLIDNIEQILKSLYDDNNIKIQIVATGSWLWQVEKLWSSLVWRVKEINIYPFDFYEYLEFNWVDTTFLDISSYDEFMFDNIKDYLKEYYIFWGYPEVVKQKTKKDKIEKISWIIDIYLRKDISFLLWEKDVINFKKIFIFLSYNISSLLNIWELSSHLWVSRNKVEFYISILEKSFLLHKVYPFFSNSRKEQSKQPEFFLSDLWIINYFKNSFTQDIFDWNIIENFVFLELLKNKVLNSDEIKTYNKINGSEIDFIYQFREGGVIPIEVKINNKDIIPRIFSSFNDDYSDNIKFFTRTTTSLIWNRSLNTKQIKILPYFMINNILK